MSPHRLLMAATRGIPRILALTDSAAGSDSYGSGDRGFWYYRTLVDFEGSTWVQPMLGLLTLHDLAVTDNPWRADPRLLEASRAMLKRWAQLQHADGSVDEWYRNERSYCPTAFTAAAAGLTILRFGSRLDPQLASEARRALARSATWLSSRENPTVANQGLAASVALFSAANATGNPLLRTTATDSLKRVLARQSPEGWFPEYGGADLGYSTLALDLLALLDQLGVDVNGAAERLTRFISGFMAPDGSLPGRLGSRATSHSFGFGLLHFSTRFEVAGKLASIWLNGFGAGVIEPHAVDDRYLAYFYFNAFALAAEASSTTTVAPSTATELAIGDFSEIGGLSMQQWADGLLAQSSATGGSLAIWLPDRGWHYNLGYRLELEGGRQSANCLWAHPIDSQTVAHPFYMLRKTRPLERYAIPFRMATSLLALPGIAAALQSRIKARFVTERSTAPWTLTRKVQADEACITIVDDLKRTKATGKVAEIHPCVSAPVHSPSARQDTAWGIVPADWNSGELADKLSRFGVLKLTYRLQRTSVGLKIDCSSE